MAARAAHRTDRSVPDRRYAVGLRTGGFRNAYPAILVGEARQALALSDGLREQGILVTAIRPPTVPQGSARLRVTLSAAHSPEQVELLLEALAGVRDSQEGVQ